MSAAEPSKSRVVDASGSIFHVRGVAAEENKTSRSMCHLLARLQIGQTFESRSIGLKEVFSPMRSLGVREKSWTSLPTSADLVCLVFPT